MKLYEKMMDRERKQLAVLVDPDKLTKEKVVEFASLCNSADVDYIFAGGSLVVRYRMDEMISSLKDHTDIPVVIFPGNSLQISAKADGILLLSLISGRNADMLIGKHVEAAPLLKSSGLEIISTGYMLIESGAITTALYMSNSWPIPAEKPDVAACTALAGQMLGMKTIYMDAGSGALQCVPPPMISAVKLQLQIPLIVGGGINTTERCIAACHAGADVVVVGNAFETQPNLITSFARAVHGAG